MAHQCNHYTPGFVYIFQDRTGAYKIGLSRNVKKRQYFLQKTYGELRLVSSVWVLNMRWLESILHKQFKKQRVYRGQIDGGTEWFNLNLVQLLKLRLLLKLQAAGINTAYGAVILLALYVAFSLPMPSQWRSHPHPQHPHPHPHPFLNT
jgi:T5orf172 domain